MFSATRLVAATSSSSAAQTLQRRAIQCSFSSVFHIRNANNGKLTKESQIAESIFIKSVAMPLFAMGFIGSVVFIRRKLAHDDNGIAAKTF